MVPGMNGMVMLSDLNVVTWSKTSSNMTSSVSSVQSAGNGRYDKRVCCLFL